MQLSQNKKGIEIKQISALGILFTFKTGEFVWPVLSENIIECLKRSVPTTSAQVMMMTTIMIIMIVIILIIIRMCIMITMQCYLSFTY